MWSLWKPTLFLDTNYICENFFHILFENWSITANISMALNPTFIGGSSGQNKNGEL